MTTPEYEREILAWRAERLARLTAATGWLSLIARVELPPGEHRVGGDPMSEVALPSDKAPASVGRLLSHASGVTFTPAAEVEIGIERSLTQSTERVLGPIELTTDARGEPDRLVLGSLRIEIVERAGQFVARVRDSQSDALRGFQPIAYYPIESAWRVVARVVPYQPDKRIDLAYESGGIESYRCPGAAVFSWQGVEYRVDAVFDGDRPRLYLVFGDQTNRDATYGAGRFLYAPLPQAGKVILDFNQAFNPPCAFTPYAVCPLPPAQNRLALRVEAGEKRPH
jgi:uncharacterized protein (DUF1684 family)